MTVSKNGQAQTSLPLTRTLVAVLKVLDDRHVTYHDCRPDADVIWIPYSEHARATIQYLKKHGIKCPFYPEGTKRNGRIPAWYLPPDITGTAPTNKARRSKRSSHAIHYKDPKNVKIRHSTDDYQESLKHATSLPSKKDTAQRPPESTKPIKVESITRTKNSRPCSYCTNLGTSKCAHGGFAICSNFREKEEHEKWPEMRKGASGWGPPTPEDDPSVPVFDSPAKNPSSGHTKNKKNHSSNQKKSNKQRGNKKNKPKQQNKSHSNNNQQSKKQGSKRR